MIGYWGVRDATTWAQGQMVANAPCTPLIGRRDSALPVPVEDDPFESGGTGQDRAAS